MSSADEKSVIINGGTGKEKKKSKEQKKNTEAKNDNPTGDFNKDDDVKKNHPEFKPINDNVVEKIDDTNDKNNGDEQNKTDVTDQQMSVEKNECEEKESEIRLIDGTKREAKIEGEKKNKTRKKSIVTINDNDDEIDVVTFAELLQQNLLKELMNKAERKTKELKLNMLSQLGEVFRLFDIDRDGVIGESDLKFTFWSLGDINVSEEKIKNMLNECPSPLDFHTFVGLFESKEMEFDSEFELIRAFAKWDSQKSGLISEEKIRNDLMRKGDKFTEKDADRALEEAPVYDEGGDSLMIDYIEFCNNLCGLQNARNSEFFKEQYSRSGSFRK